MVFCTHCPDHFLHFATSTITLSRARFMFLLCDCPLSWQDAIQTYPQVHTIPGYVQDGVYRVPMPSPPPLQAQPAPAGYFGSYYWWIGEKFAALPGFAKIKCELDIAFLLVVWGFLEWIISQTGYGCYHVEMDVDAQALLKYQFVPGMKWCCLFGSVWRIFVVWQLNVF